VGKRVRYTGGAGVGKERAATAIPRHLWAYASTAPRCLLADWLFPLLPGQLASVGVVNTEDNRRGLRELLVGTEQCENQI
jgi:hypothetical protein